MLTNMHNPPAEGNFCDKPDHMGYVDQNDCKENNYSISKHTLKWTQTVVVSTPGLSILNCFILPASCSSKLFYQNFRLYLARELIEGGKCPDIRQLYTNNKPPPPGE
jgi:hypothetical protein